MAKDKIVEKRETVHPENPQFVEEHFIIQPVFRVDEDGVVDQVSAGIGRDGKEYGDPVPLEPPVGFDAPPDLMEMIKRMVRSEHHLRAAHEAGFDPIEEMEDFDVPEDEAEFGPTPFEDVFDPETGRSKSLEELNGLREAANRPQGAPQPSPPQAPGKDGGVSGGVTETPPAPPPKQGVSSGTST